MPCAPWNKEPFVTVTAVNGGTRVTCANAAARALGIGPRLPLADARALHPSLRSVELDPQAVQADLDRLADWCLHFTPWTAVEGLDSDGGAALWLDITGCAHLFGGEDAMLTNLGSRLADIGLNARMGVGDGKGAAWAAARFLDPDKPFAVIPEGAARQILPSLPVAALRLDPATVETLRRLGLRRIADLLALPRAPLAARFGKEVAQRLDEALGRRPEPFAPRKPPAPYRLRLGFPEPIGLVDDVAAGLARLLDALCERLTRDGKGVRSLVLESFRIDGTVIGVEIGTARPVRDPAHLARLLGERLEEIDSGFGIEALVITAPAVDPLTPSQKTFAKTLKGEPQGPERDKEFSLLMDRLNGRLGSSGVIRPQPRPSHIPEGAVRPVHPLDPTSSNQCWPAKPRPPVLLPRPEPVETTNEGSSVGGISLGPPPRIRWRRHTLRLVRAEGPERVAPEWWHSLPLPAPDMVRDYWRAEDGEGRRLWMFRQGASWFIHGILP